MAYQAIHVTNPIQFILAMWAIFCLFFRQYTVLAILSLCTMAAVATAFTASLRTTERIIVIKEVQAKIPPVETFGEAPAPPMVGIESQFVKDVVDDRAPAAAPMAPKSEMTTKAYIAKFAGIARNDMQKFGVPASISLAQGLIESRAGNSSLAVKNNNHFGMKCFSKNCRKGHCTNFTDDTHKDFFLKFGNAKSSWDAHAKLVTSGRYAKLKKYGRDYRRWAIGLKSVGYATDRTYAEKLIGIIERYDLHQYDR